MELHCRPEVRLSTRCFCLWWVSKICKRLQKIFEYTAGIFPSSVEHGEIFSASMLFKCFEKLIFNFIEIDVFYLRNVFKEFERLIGLRR